MIQVGDKVYYTVKDINQKTGWHERTIRSLIRSGELKGTKRGRSYYVSAENLQAYLEGRKQDTE